MLSIYHTQWLNLSSIMQLICIFNFKSRLHGPSVSNPKMSKHWRKLKALMTTMENYPPALSCIQQIPCTSEQAGRWGFNSTFFKHYLGYALPFQLSFMVHILDFRSHMIWSYKLLLMATASPIFTRDSVAIARICHGNSVRLSVCHMGGSAKNGEARITQFSPYSSPIPLVFWG